MPSHPTVSVAAIAAAAAGILALAVSAQALAQRQGPTVQQGLWEITVAITDTNLLARPPGGKFPAKVFQACLSQTQADNPVNFLSDVVAPISSDCKAGPVRMTGSRATWPLQCPKVPDAGPYGGSGAFEFSRTAFDGTMRQARPLSGDKSLETSMNIIGKRLGDC